MVWSDKLQKKLRTLFFLLNSIKYLYQFDWVYFQGHLSSSILILLHFDDVDGTDVFVSILARTIGNAQ